MTAATFLRQGEPSGLRPVDPSRDLVRVAWLIQTAFADDLDQAGGAQLALGGVRWYTPPPAMKATPLQQVKERAKRIMCASALKQWGIAISSYDVANNKIPQILVRWPGMGSRCSRPYALQ